MKNVLEDITMNNDGDDITITDTIGPGEELCEQCELELREQCHQELCEQ